MGRTMFRRRVESNRAEMEGSMMSRVLKRGDAQSKRADRRGY